MIRWSAVNIRFGLMLLDLKSEPSMIRFSGSTKAYLSLIILDVI